MSKFCQTCRYWERIADKIDLGICHNDSVKCDVHISVDTFTADEGGDVWTASGFGCVWHNEDNIIVKLPDQKDLFST